MAIDSGIKASSVILSNGMTLDDWVKIQSFNDAFQRHNAPQIALLSPYQTTSIPNDGAYHPIPLSELSTINYRSNNSVYVVKYDSDNETGGTLIRGKGNYNEMRYMVVINLVATMRAAAVDTTIPFAFQFSYRTTPGTGEFTAWQTTRMQRKHIIKQANADEWEEVLICVPLISAADEIEYRLEGEIGAAASQAMSVTGRSFGFILGIPLAEK